MSWVVRQAPSLDVADQEWGWERIAWPFGPGEAPDYMFWHRGKRRTD